MAALSRGLKCSRTCVYAPLSTLSGRLALEPDLEF
jgi:hypothetical protein